MNILILSWRGPGHPNAGGAEAVTLEHAKAWVKAGHDVILFTSLHQKSKKAEVIDGVKIIRRGDAEIGVRIQAFFWYFFGDHNKFDLVIDEFHGISFFTALYIKAPKLAFIHEVAKEVWFLNYILPKAVIGYLIEPLIFKLFYRSVPFMTVSDSTKTDLINWGIPKKNINVIHNGASIVFPKKGTNKEKNTTLIFLGALSKDKGIEDALEIFGLVDDQVKNVQYWVVGKGNPEYLRMLKEKSHQLGIKNKIKFWGYVEEEKKFELLKKSHILVNPSIREGWGLVVIEAAAMGTPTIAYRVSGLKDSIIHKRTGILVERQDVNQMTQGIVNLVRNKKLYSSLQKNALRWSTKFDWNKSTKKSLHLINKIAKV